MLSKGEVDSKKVRVEFSLEDMDMSEVQDGATEGVLSECPKCCEEGGKAVLMLVADRPDKNITDTIKIRQV